MALGAVSTLAEIPFIATAELSRGGFIASSMFYVEGTWRCWLPIGEPGKLIEMQAWPAENLYWGDTAAEPHDFGIAFLNFVAQHANLRTVQHAFSGIRDDLFNLSASLHKLGLVHAAGGHGASRLAATEVEYILMLCRSIFDLLQEALRAIWDTVTLTDPAARKRQLKKAFSEMALHADKVRSAAELMQTFGLSQSLADCYARHAPMFVKVRRFRDDIVHRGHDIQTIFHGETGFLIQRRLGPFELDIWRPGEVAENDLAPLPPALGLLIHGTLSACDDFARALASCIQFPPPVVPGLCLFMRGYFNSTLISTLEDAEVRVADGLLLTRF